MGHKIAKGSFCRLSSSFLLDDDDDDVLVFYYIHTVSYRLSKSEYIRNSTLIFRKNAIVKKIHSIQFFVPNFFI